jgi:hypothetical protein
MHEALAAYYDPDLDDPRNPEFAIDVFKAYVANWLAEQDNPSEDQYIWAEDALELGVGMLKYYFVWAQKHDTFIVVSVEKDFEVPIPGMPGVTYSFRIDGLVMDPDGRFWLLENKTTAQFSDSTEYLAMDDQCGSYLWGLTQIDFPVHAEGVIYNELKKKVPQPLRELAAGGYSVNKSQDTTFEIAVNTLKEQYEKIPRHYWEFLDHLKAKPNNFVRRTPVRRNRREIEILGETLRYEVLDMVSNPTIYRAPSRINCSGCPFIAPCILKWEGGDFQQLLDWEYTERKSYYGRTYA